MKETLSTLTSPGVQGVERIKKLRGLVMLLKALERREFISMMHHTDEIGSPIPILGELSKIVVLLGFKDSTVPATVDGTSLLEITEENTPKIDFLSVTKDKDEVFKPTFSTTPTIQTKICNSIVLTPWLANVLIKNNAGTMGNAL
eukprot:9678999-Ditylum_brightwellii.AAC.1